ncbi:hypothetical protein Pmani_026442 [Petrolisthes manimaculis]|uniref:Uncharacterized protein n=1 Tax=Petrolisthes manimaculis TaxID=1843537 RepID=A0AAE1P5X0_9EUCA|nr:hypothetical protein Pmani_026442 [Petrolisthes manimaculis]
MHNAPPQTVTAQHPPPLPPAGVQMKFYPQPADSPDGVHAWVHEDLLEPRYGGAHASDPKATMDLDSFLRDLRHLIPPLPNSNP